MELTIKIDNRSSKGKALLLYLRALEQTDDFIEIIKDAKNKNILKDDKSTLMDEIEQGLREVKLMQEGKLEKKSLKDILNV